jgi:hypothetical protein
VIIMILPGGSRPSAVIIMIIIRSGEARPFALLHAYTLPRIH